MSLIVAARKYLAALDVICDITDRGQDDSGKRDTPAYREWLAADCAYTEALAALRRAVKVERCTHKRTGDASPARIFQCPDCFVTWRMGENPP